MSYTAGYSKDKILRSEQERGVKHYLWERSSPVPYALAVLRDKFERAKVERRAARISQCNQCFSKSQEEEESENMLKLQ